MHPLLKSNINIDMQVYAANLAQNVDHKFEDVVQFFPEGGWPRKVFDDGCADGALLERLSKEFPFNEYNGVDLDRSLLAQALRRKYHNAPNFYHYDLVTGPIKPIRADVVIANSVIHELYSYAGGVESVRKYLRNKFDQLLPGGRLIIRDLVSPADGDREVLLWTEWRDGVCTSTPQDFKPTQLSTRSLFLRFSQDRNVQKWFRRLPNQDDFALGMRVQDAMEFIQHMPYSDHWEKEIQETFCFWDFDQWITELQAAGFEIMDGSRSYVNAWRVNNQFQGKVALLGTDFQPIRFPVTNLVIGAEKPFR